MGLYSERIGNIHVIMNDSSQMAALQDFFSDCIRSEYLCPIYVSGKIVEHVLLNSKKEWFAELKENSDRLRKIRKGLAKAIKDNETPGNWDFIEKQTGFFSFLGLTPDQVYEFGEKYHIYGQPSSRYNLVFIIYLL